MEEIAEEKTVRMEGKITQSANDNTYSAYSNSRIAHEEHQTMQKEMSRIKTITVDELRHMKDKEGLILQGCGGKLEDWRDGINEMLTKDGILLDGSKFDNCVTFEYDKTTCLLFLFDGEKLSMGKLAMWRLATYEAFGGTWLSDYVPKKLGGFIGEELFQKPDCPLIGQNGNIFNLMGLATRTLQEHGLSKQAEEMCERIKASDNYYAALNVIGEYVNITSMEENDDLEEVGIQQINL